MENWLSWYWTQSLGWDKSYLWKSSNQATQSQFLLTTYTESVLNISDSVDQKCLLLDWHSTFNHLEVNTLQNCFKGNSSLFEPSTDQLKSSLNILVQKNIHNLINELRTRATSEVVYSFSVDLNYIIFHG